MPKSLGYVEVKLIEAQEKEIRRALKSVFIEPMEEGQYHCTMMYDQTGIRKELTELDPEKIFRAKVTGVNLLGKWIVLMLDSEDIMTEFDRLLRSGFTHSYDDILPHISLLKEPSNGEVKLLEIIFEKWIGKELYFNQQHVDWIDEDD